MRWAVWLVLALFAAPGWSRDSVSVQLSWHHQFQFAGYYVAKEMGFYRSAGLEVELRPGGPSAMQPVTAVVDGRADFGVTNAGLAIDRMNGLPVVALAAVLQSSPAVWVASGRRDSQDVAAWRDAPRYVPFADKDSSELIALFTREGDQGRPQPPTSNDPVAPTQYGQGAGIRAAYLTKEVGQLQAAGAEFSVLDPRDFGIDFYSEVLFTSEAFLRDRPGAVERFRSATLRGWAAAFADVERTAHLIHEAYAPSTSIPDLIREGLAMRALARMDMVDLGHMSKSRWAVIAEQQRDSHFGKGTLDTAAFVRIAGPDATRLAPDPVRITLVGLVVVLLLSAGFLLRSNSELVRANHALNVSSKERQSTEIRYQFLMDVAPYAIAIYGLEDGRVRYANEQAEARVAQADMTGGRIQDWIPGLAPDQPLAERFRSGRVVREAELQLAGSNTNDGRWTAVSGRAIEYEGSHCVFLALSDITDRKAAQRDVELLSEQRAMMLVDIEALQQRLREASLHDALTGLYNRRFFDSIAEREFARCRREDKLVGLLVVDADHFKHVNDRYGHAGGDDVLRALGAILGTLFRTDDFACRYGGEEFVVLLPGISEEAALARAEAMRAQVAESEVDTAAGTARFTVSVGVAIADPALCSPTDLFASADAAVYAAKASGRNCVRLAAPASAVTDAVEVGEGA